MSGRGGIYKGPNGEDLHGDGRPVGVAGKQASAEPPDWILGQYVWVEGRLTLTQPVDFPKKLRVYVPGVGTGIAGTVKPVQEAVPAPPPVSALRERLGKLVERWRTLSLPKAGITEYYTGIKVQAGSCADEIAAILNEEPETPDA